MPLILRSISNYNYYKDCHCCTNYFEKNVHNLENYSQSKPFVKLVQSLRKTAMNTLRAG